MRNFFLVSSVLFVLSFSSFSQEYEMISQPKQTELASLFGYIKHVLPVGIDFEYNIHSNDLQADFEAMKDFVRYDSAFFVKHRNLSKSDPNNPFHYNNMATCYKENSMRDSSQIYFYKAMQNMSMDYFRDSAAYYSYLSVIKQNLGVDGLFELKRAIKLNPIDSTAVGLYPMYLMGQSKFEEARTVCEKALKKEYQQSPLLMLGLNEIFSQLAKYNPENDSNCKVVRNTDLNEILNFKSVEKFAKKAKVQEAKNVTPLLETLAFAFKIGFFEKDKNYNPILKFTTNDNQRIDQLIKWNHSSIKSKTLNLFTANKNLSFLFFLKNNHDSTLFYAKEAINIFPIMKNADKFNGNDIFSILEMSLRMQGKYSDLAGVISSDIDAKYLFGIPPFLGNLNLATLFMYDNNYQMCAEHAIRAKNINEDDDIIQNIHPTFTQLNKLGYKELEYYKTNSKTSYKVFLSDKNNVILYIDKKKAFFESSSKMNNYTGLKSDNYKNLESEFEWILKEGKIENNESEEEKVIRKKAEILVDLKLENKSLNLNKILSIIVSKNEKNIKEVLEKIDLTH